MINGVVGESESWLLGILNRVVRCSHRNHGRPITPRGGGQSYAVCLDCGTRFAYDLNAMRVETSVSDRHASERESEREKEEILDIPEPGPIPGAPARRETMWNDSIWRRRDVGTVVVLCLGAITLAGAFFYSSNRPPVVKHPPAAVQARPPLPAGSVALSTAEQARPALAADSVAPSSGLPTQESGAEMAPTPESAAIASPTVPSESEPITEPDRSHASTAQKTIESDSTSGPTTPRSNRLFRLESKGPVVVLARRAGAALELAQHPERLRKLIRRGALFTVPRGTPIKLVEGKLGNTFVIKVKLMAGPLVGREAWAQKPQISP